MNNLKVSTGMLLLIGMLSVMLLGVGGVGLFGIHQSDEALKTVYLDRTLAAEQLGEIKSLQPMALP
jgi:methyl-accepting chemotaxis protein-1 (serine sensor receptor)